MTDLQKAGALETLRSETTLIQIVHSSPVLCSATANPRQGDTPLEHTLFVRPSQLWLAIVLIWGFAQGTVNCDVHWGRQCHLIRSWKCTSYSWKCTSYSLKCTTYSWKCTFYSSKCKSYSWICTTYSWKCTPIAQNARLIAENARLIAENAHHIAENAHHIAETVYTYAYICMFIYTTIRECNASWRVRGLHVSIQTSVQIDQTWMIKLSLCLISTTPRRRKE